MNSGRYLEEVLIEMSSAGVAAFLVAEAGRDALEEAPDFRILSEALAIVDQPVIAAGGVRNLEDLHHLMALETAGRRIKGVIVGREVTQGRFSIDDAKAVIAEGVTAQEEVVEEQSAPPAQVLGIEKDFLAIAEQLERGAAHARTALDHLKAGDIAGGLAQGLSVHGHLLMAGRVLDSIAEHHSDVAGRRA
jgi:tRNA-dihydrouridine synthase